MKRVVLICVSLLFLGVLAAQQPVLLRNSQYLDFEGINVTLPNGNTMVFWNDTSSGSSDILAQKINPEGTVLWNTPRIVADGPMDQRLLSVVIASDQNILVLFNEYSHSGGGMYHRMQRISQAGQRLWGNQGIEAMDINTYYTDIQMVPNGIGGAYLVYLTGNTDSGLYGMNFDAMGVNLWPHLPLPGNADAYDMEALADGAGGIIINSIVYIAGTGSRNILVRLDAAGDVVGSNPLLNPNAVVPAGFKMIRDNAGDYILYTFASDGVSLQKMDVNGNLLLNAVQNIVSPGQETLYEIQIQPGSGTGAVYAYTCRENNDSYHLKIQYLDGNLQPSWNQPLDIPITQETGSLQIDTANGIWCTYISWVYDNHGYNGCVYCCKANNDGTLAIPPTAISSVTNYKQDPIIHSTANNALALWGDQSTCYNGLQIQVITSNGDLVLPADGRMIYGVLNGSTEMKSTLPSGSGFINIYEDTRIAGDERIYFQITNNFGQPVLEANGIALNVGSNCSENYLGSVKTPYGYTAVLYTTCNGSTYSLWYQEISDQGTLRWPGYGICIVQDSSSNFPDSKIDKAGNDLLVIWPVLTPDSYYSSIYGQRFHEGQAVWAAGGKLLVQAENDYLIPEALEEDYVLYTRESYTNNTVTLSALKLAYNGDPYSGWPLTGVEVIPPSDNYLRFLNSGIMNGKLAVFVQRADDTSISIHAQLISPAAQMLWGTTGILVDQNEEFEYYLIPDAVYEDDVTFLIYSSYNNGLGLQSVNENGQFVYPDDGVTLTSGQGMNQGAVLAKYNNGTCSVFYVDYADNLYSLCRKDISPEGTILNPEPSYIVSNRQFLGNLMIANTADYSNLGWNDYYFYERGDAIELRSLWTCRVDAIPVGVDDPLPVPIVNSIQNYPNPFRESTKIVFGMKEAAQVEINVYNMKGQHVRSLMDEAKAAGNYELLWDGEDEQGRKAAAGIYFYKIHAGSFSSRKKMILLK